VKLRVRPIGTAGRLAGLLAATTVSTAAAATEINVTGASATHPAY